MIIILFTFLLWIIILDNLLLGIFLLIKAFQIKFINLYSMGIGFVFFFVGLFGNFILGYGFFFEQLFVELGYFLLALFTYLTFHRRKVDYKAKLLLYLSLVFMFTRIFLGIMVEIHFNPITRYSERILITCYAFLVFYWLGGSSLSAYKRLRNTNVAPWLKTRYKGTSIVSFLWPFHALLGLLLPWNIEFGDPSNIISLIHFIITVILSLIFIIGMIVAWIIPENLKNYINRKKGYEPPDDKEISEDELIKLIKSQLP